MKRILHSAAAILAVLMLLCGCTHLSTDRNLIGTWRSADGCTVRFSANHVMRLYDADGRELFDEPLSYGVSTNMLYIEREGQAVEIFECRVNGDRLTLVYTDMFLNAAGLKEADSISLVRIDEAS